jgi:glycine/D-amino acid oxidase-like deaminating enzyme
MLGTRLMHDWSALGLPGASPVTLAPLHWLMDDEHAAQAQAILRQHPGLNDPIHLLPTQQHRRFERSQAPWLLHDASGAVTDTRLSVRALLHGAAQLGAHIREHHPIDITLDDTGHVQWHGPTGHTMSTDVLLLTPGRALPSCLKTSHLHQRVVPQIELANVPDIQGCLIDQLSGTYLRPLGPTSAYMGWSGQPFEGADPPPIDTHEANEKLTALCRSMGWLKRPQVRNHLAGSDAYTRDNRPHIQWHQADKLCIATGLSGRGFKFGVLLGAALAHSVCDKLGAGNLNALPHSARQVLPHLTREQPVHAD